MSSGWEAGREQRWCSAAPAATRLRRAATGAATRGGEERRGCGGTASPATPQLLAATLGETGGEGAQGACACWRSGAGREATRGQRGGAVAGRSAWQAGVACRGYLCPAAPTMAKHPQRCEEKTACEGGRRLARIGAGASCCTRRSRAEAGLRSCPEHASYRGHGSSPEQQVRCVHSRRDVSKFWR